MINTKDIGLSAYNDFGQFSKLSYLCIKKILNDNELIWKLLKYNTSDAWAKPNLTYDEKTSLIYAGQSDSSKYNVFMDGKQPDVLIEETTLLRIMPSYAVGINRTVGYIEILFEIYSHYKINHLSNYQTRIDTIAEELLGIFNGVNMMGLGLMAFTSMIDESSRLFQAGQIPFGGKHIIFAIHSA